MDIPFTEPKPFTEKKPWSERRNAPTNPGVYVIFKNDCIVYIGETKAMRGLRGRLSQFNRAAGNGISNHAGGRTFYSIFGQINPEQITFQYHDAVEAGVIPEDHRQYVRTIENSLFLRFQEIHNRLPACNTIGGHQN